MHPYREIIDVPEVKSDYRTDGWYREILQIFADHGATPASIASGVTRRTIQRWARRAGVTSGYNPRLARTPDDTNAGYRRGVRTEEAIEAHQESVRDAKQRRVQRFHDKETTPACGKASTYSNYDCRGEACRTAWSVYLKRKRGTLDGTPSMTEQMLVDLEGNPLHCPCGLNPLEN